MKKIITISTLLLFGMALMVKAQSNTDSFQVQGAGDDTKTYRVSKDSYYSLMAKRQALEKEMNEANELSDKGDAFYKELMRLKQNADPSNPTSINAYNSKLDQFYAIKEKVTNALNKAIKDAQAYNEDVRRAALN